MARWTCLALLVLVLGGHVAALPHSKAEVETLRSSGHSDKHIKTRLSDPEPLPSFYGTTELHRHDHLLRHKRTHHKHKHVHQPKTTTEETKFDLIPNQEIARHKQAYRAESKRARARAGKKLWSVLVSSPKGQAVLDDKFAVNQEILRPIYVPGSR